MGIEIERKFLINLDKWFPPENGLLYRQGYINTINGNTVRVRVVAHQGYLTLKSKTKGAKRAEFEYLIPLEEAEEMLKTLCDRPLIEKIRYKIVREDLIWEIDEFLGDNQGLILAEVELKAETQQISLPEWIGEEVTHDLRYYNSNLAKNPFSQWQSK